MNDTDKQAALSAIRTLLTVTGTGLVAKGYFDQVAMGEIIGAVMILVPLIWGALDKYWTEAKTKDRETVAVNAGIAVSNSDPIQTPPLEKDEAQAAIQKFSQTKDET